MLAVYAQLQHRYTPQSLPHNMAAPPPKRQKLSHAEDYTLEHALAGAPETSYDQDDTITLATPAGTSTQITSTETPQTSGRRRGRPKGAKSFANWLDEARARPESPSEDLRSSGRKSKTPKKYAIEIQEKTLAAMPVKRIKKKEKKTRSKELKSVGSAEQTFAQEPRETPSSPVQRPSKFSTEVGGGPYAAPATSAASAARWQPSKGSSNSIRASLGVSSHSGRAPSNDENITPSSTPSAGSVMAVTALESPAASPSHIEQPRKTISNVESSGVAKRDFMIHHENRSTTSASKLQQTPSHKRKLDTHEYRSPLAEAAQDRTNAGRQEHSSHKATTIRASAAVTAKQIRSSVPAPVSSSARALSGEEQLEGIRRIVLAKAMGRRRIPIVGHEEQLEKVRFLTEQLVLAGESNSMLLIGARGSGKTAIVNNVLAELGAKHNADFHTIRLNGFVQTDDKLALREIWRQLGREMEIDDDQGPRNYADTLTTLLALLSHTPEDESGRQAAKAVVFIIDEFDLFTTHPRQTLLYNLFDIAQSRKAPIAVLGLTTRIDVVESLEKRVKSRFSHRYVHVGLPKSLSGLKSICRAALSLSEDEMDFKERMDLGAGTGKGGALAFWNGAVQTILDLPEITAHLSHIHYTTKSVPDALQAFLMPLSRLSPASDLADLISSSFPTRLSAPDSKLHLLPSLSTLAQALLIAAARLDIVLKTDTCNFNMAYEEYSNLAAKARLAASTAGSNMAGIGGKVWGKSVAKSAWEKLVQLELLIPAASSSSGWGAADMVRCDVALEEIPAAVPDLERAMERWCKEIAI
ncbi:hypothetical protein MRB53_038206 [Persea americana]|nr:hypothetical protein MRB53_038206 [Persea americana]